MKFAKSLIAVAALLSATVFSAQAADVYKWTGADGKVYYGSKPPKNAKNAATVKGPKVSRYSSDKALKSLKKSVDDSNIALSAPTAQPSTSKKGKTVVAKADDKTARASMNADIPGKSDIQETNLVKGELLTKNLKTDYDNEGRLNGCTVDIINQSNIPISNFAINFEFPDGTIVPGTGPEIVDPGATVQFELSKAVLPLAFGAVGDNNPKPKINISYY